MIRKDSSHTNFKSLVVNDWSSTCWTGSRKQMSHTFAVLLCYILPYFPDLGLQEMWQQCTLGLIMSCTSFHCIKRFINLGTGDKISLLVWLFWTDYNSDQGCKTEADYMSTVGSKHTYVACNSVVSDKFWGDWHVIRAWRSTSRVSGTCVSRA